jgi:hypothetical protein
VSIGTNVIGDNLGVVLALAVLLLVCTLCANLTASGNDLAVLLLGYKLGDRYSTVCVLLLYPNGLSLL